MLTQAQKDYIFSFIDICAIINLPSRKDRLKDVIPQLSKIGLNPYYKNIIIDGIRFDDLHFMSGRAGCSAAHCKAITYGFDNNFRNILVLEDDCYFIDERLEAIYYALKDLEKINWDVCYLGARIKSPMQDFSKGLYRINNWGCNHAVIYNKKVIPHILKSMPKYDAGYIHWMQWVARHECFDAWQPKFLGQNADFFVFHVKQLCALQVANFSDINQKDSDGIKILEDDFNRHK